MNNLLMNKVCDYLDSVQEITLRAFEVENPMSGATRFEKFEYARQLALEFEEWTSLHDDTVDWDERLTIFLKSKGWEYSIEMTATDQKGEVRKVW